MVNEAALVAAKNHAAHIDAAGLEFAQVSAAASYSSSLRNDAGTQLLPASSSPRSALLCPAPPAVPYLRRRSHKTLAPAGHRVADHMFWKIAPRVLFCVMLSCGVDGEAVTIVGGKPGKQLANLLTIC